MKLFLIFTLFIFYSSIFSQTDIDKNPDFFGVDSNHVYMISDTEILDWIFRNCSVSYDSLDVYDRETTLDVMDDMYREQLDSYEDNEPYEYE